jgi:hypothetical protein
VANFFCDSAVHALLLSFTSECHAMKSALAWHICLPWHIAAALQAVGHSYNLFDLHSRRLLNVEVGPGGAGSVLEVTRGSFYFHANMFKHLAVQQRIDNSSYHREARALQLQVGCV